MSRKYSISTPVTLSVVAIIMSVTMVVGWNLIFAFYYVVEKAELGAGYWLINVGGNVFMILIVATLGLLLASTIRRTAMVRRQDTFIDGVTHELKSPLASIRLALDTMSMRKLTEAQRQRFEGIMRSDVDRLQAFIEHVLEAGRLEHGERELRLEPVVVERAVERCVGQIGQRHGIAPESIAVEVKLRAPEAPLLLDPMALDIVLLNLLDNAVKYAQPPRVIQLRLWDDAQQLHLEVQDNGVGISRRDVKRVFDRFYRVTREDLPRVRGTGLGLYLVKTVVERLEGKVRASSPGHGQGATFTVTLPRISA